MLKKLASDRAPRVSSWPVPCVSTSAAASGVAVYCRMAFTMFGVSPGFASSMSAMAPATAGAAMLVPVRVM